MLKLYVDLFPKGEFLRTHRVGPLGLNGFLHLGLLFEIFQPYESWPLFGGLLVLVGGVFLGQMLAIFKFV